MQNEPAWISFNSSNLDRGRYDIETKVLELQFKNSDVTYNYDEVGPDIWQGLCAAVSPGQYFRNYIKGRYRFYRA